MDDRGISNVIGYTLLLGIVIAGLTMVVVIGGGQLEGIQEEYRTQQAVNTMASLDSDASLVALGTSELRRVEMGASGQIAVLPNTGRLTITVINGTNRTEIANTTLGAVRNELGDTEIAYQGGGVWRDGPGNTTMVSPPEFHYRGQTLTFPIVTIGNHYRGTGSTLTVESNGTERVFPNATLSNPVEGATVRVAVTSDYHGGWARYFRTRTTGEVDHVPSENLAAVNLTAPIDTIFDSAVSATASGPSAITVSGNPAGCSQYSPGAVAAVGAGVGVGVSAAAPPPGGGRPGGPGAGGGGGGGASSPYDCPIDRGATLPSASPQVENAIADAESNCASDPDCTVVDSSFDGGGMFGPGTYYYDGSGGTLSASGVTFDTSMGAGATSPSWSTRPSTFQAGVASTSSRPTTAATSPGTRTGRSTSAGARPSTPEPRAGTPRTS